MINLLKKLLNLNYYTSELDQFLRHFDKSHPKPTVSQRAEIEKAARISRLRDDSNPPEDKLSLWDQF